MYSQLHPDFHCYYSVMKSKRSHFCKGKILVWYFINFFWTTDNLRINTTYHYPIDAGNAQTKHF